MAVTINTNVVYTPPATPSRLEITGVKNIDDSIYDLQSMLTNKDNAKDVQSKISDIINAASGLQLDNSSVNNEVAVISDSQISEKIDMIIKTVKAMNQMVSGMTDKPSIDEKLSIDTSGTGAKTVTLPNDIFLIAKTKGIDNIELKSQEATLNFKTDTIPETDLQGSQINISVEKKQVQSVEGISKEQAQIIGDKPIYDFSIVAGGKQVHQLNEKAPLEVTIPYTLKQGEDPKQITVYYINEKGELEEVKGAEISYDSVLSKATFKLTHFSKYVIMQKQVLFNDLGKYSWAQGEISVLAKSGIVNGRSNNTFEPAANVTRAEFLKMLLLALNLKPEGVSTFSDVKSTAWYSPYAAAAQKAGIVKGTGKGEFGPAKMLTRQDMCVMVYNALQVCHKALPTADSNVLRKFKDAKSISAYALKAACAVSNEKIIQGVSSNKFAPKDNTTRAQAAVIVYRLINYLKK